MPNPNKERGKTSKRNLKPGIGRRPKRSEQEREIQRISKRLLSDPTYQRTLIKKLRDGTLHPSVIVMLYYYAHGKPKELIESVNVTPVRIVHEYASEEKK